MSKPAPSPAPQNSRPEVLSLEDFLMEFKIPRSTFTRWRRLGRPVPRFRRMPNGELRTARADVDLWFDALPEKAA